MVLAKVRINIGSKCTVLNIYIFYNLNFQLDKLDYDVTMERRVIDIDNYLPFRKTEDILAFCNQHDSLYKEKKSAFRERLYAAGDTSSMTNFIGGIVSAVFDAPLLGNYKWPYKK